MTRNVNYLTIQAGDKQITLIVPLQVGPVCIVKVSWFNMNLGPQKSGQKYESPFCP
jgi:hypothetical protein